MAQVLKPEIDSAIRKAALRVFARDGAAARLGDIAAEAGVATGNIYRYYESKEALFDAVVPASLARTLGRLLRERATSVNDEATYRVVSRELMAFTLEHREAVIVLLARAAGTPHASFARDTAEALVKLVARHFGVEATPVLRLVYDNLFAAIVRILSVDDDAARIRAEVDAYARYHLAGLEALHA